MAYPDKPIWQELTQLGFDFATAGVRSLWTHAGLTGVERYCLFMGAPRNGHSLIGALLDAHPEVVIAHELGVPKYLAAHFSRRQIELLLLANSKRHAVRGRRHIHYSHAVPGQWQGRYRQLRVLGDKHGEGFLLSMQARPRLFETVQKDLQPLSYFHVVRSPYDAIASVVGSSKRGRSLASAIAYFEKLYATLAGIAEHLQSGQIHEIHFEQFLEQPATELARACRFLGVEAGTDYLEACSSIVLDKPEDNRDSIPWDTPSLQRIDQLISRHPFLSRYRSHEE